MLAVGDMFVEVGQGQFHCFQHRVNRFKAVHRVFADAQCFEHGQAGQGGNALAIRREFMHHSACVGHRQGVDPVHGMRRQVVEAHYAAIGVGMGDDGLRQFAAIERFAFGLRDQFQRAGVILEPDFSPAIGALPPGMKHSAKPGWSLSRCAPRFHNSAMIGVT